MTILYFSGTGNSEYIARKFASHMDFNCHSIEEDIDFDQILMESDIIAVCYPIYGSCVPRIMREFTAAHRKSFENKKLIIFCTQMIFSGDGARAFARLLPGCDRNVIYAEHFNMPNNICNFFLFPVRKKECIKKKRKSDLRLEAVCRDIQNGIVKKRGFHTFSSLLGRFQNTIYPALEQKYKGSFTADHDCIQCGLCIKCCPMDNLSLSSKGIVQKNNCTLCYRCVNICPKQAATVAIHKKPKRQYKGVVKNSL